MEKTKLCRRCNVPHPMEDFKRSNGRGYTLSCRACRKQQNEYLREWKERRRPRAVEVEPITFPEHSDETSSLIEAISYIERAVKAKDDEIARLKERNHQLQSDKTLAEKALNDATERIEALRKRVG